MSAMRWCLPLVHGRGAGLGNELVPWARAYLMSQVLGARCLPPAFGLNARGYRQHFGTPRLDFIWQRLMQHTLPRVHFGEAEFEAHGGRDATRAFSRFADVHGLHTRSPLLVTTDGMWGGLMHVARAREFVRGTLMRSRHAGANLATLGTRLDPDRLTVALHVRLGDFEPPVDDPAAWAATYRGRFNCALPLSWFLHVGKQLRQALGEQVQFQIFSDGSAAQLAPLRELLQPVDTHCNAPTDVSDLLALSRADLLVCSVSSFSVWAAALSDAPYLWFAPQLHPHDGGLGSIWGHEERQQQADGPTAQAAAAVAAAGPDGAGRAFAIGPHDPLPPRLVALLQQRLQLQRRSGDLVRYGVAPLPAAR